MKRLLSCYIVLLIGLSLLASLYAYPTHTYDKDSKAGVEDVPVWMPYDRWTWKLLVPIVMTGSINGYINLDINAWGNYTGIIDYNSGGIVQKCYYLKIEGYGLGSGEADTDYGTVKLRVNGDPRQGSTGYNSNVPFRVLGYRIIRVNDFADVEIRLVIPSAWLHGKISAIITIYDEMEIKLNTTLAFWNDSANLVPDNMDFPLSVGERWWFNSVVHVYGYMWNSRDSQGWIEERNSTFDDYEPWNYTMTCNEYHDVSVPAGTFSCYNVTGTNNAGETNLFYEYCKDTKIYVKEVYRNIGFGSGSLSLTWILTSYSVTTSTNRISLTPSEVTHGNFVTIEGEIPSAPNEEIIVCIPEWSIYHTVSSTSSGTFRLDIRVPLLYDSTKTSIDYGSLGILAYPSSNIQNIAVATLTIHMAPPHILQGYVKFYGNITPNYTGMNVVLVNNMSGEITIVPINETTGYYEFDLSMFFYGYRHGDKIYGYVVYNNKTYGNETFVDTSVNVQTMDIIISETPLSEISLIILGLISAISILIFLERRK